MDIVEQAAEAEPKSEIDRLREENTDFRRWGIIEVAVRNPNVDSFMREWTARVEAAEAEAVSLRRERDEARASEKQALAELTARAKSLLRLRDSFINMDLEDEGDRVYFATSNDADTFRDIVDDLDGWAWHDIMHEAERDDVYATCRKQVARAESAEAENARLREALTRIDSLDEADGHDLRERHAFEAVAIARTALGGDRG